MAAEAAHRLRSCPRVARALYGPLCLGRALVLPPGAEKAPARGLLGGRECASANTASAPEPQALPAGRAEAFEARPAAPQEEWNAGFGLGGRLRQHHNCDARASQGALTSGSVLRTHPGAPCIGSICSGAWGADGPGAARGRQAGVSWRDLPIEVAHSRPLSSKAAGRKGPSTGAEEGSRGADAGGEEGQAGEEGAVSVRELATLEEDTSVLLRRAEIESLLVEGLPVGLERELAPAGSPPAEAYPFLVRRHLREFLQALQAHAEAVRGAPPAPAGQGEDEGPGPLLPADSVSGALRHHWLLLGPSGSGKSVLLGLAVAWARANGWLVLYVPRAREWARGGLYYPHPHAPASSPDQGQHHPQGARCSLWDTPLQAQQALENLLGAHRDALSECPLWNRDALPLGEAPSADRAPQRRSRPLPSSSEEPLWSLADLASLGAQERDASVSALLRLREELGHLRGTPVLIAIDEYNAWFTFSAYFEATGERSRRQIHANELRMVRALRPMAQEPPQEAGAPARSPVLVAGAFSESIAVGRLAPRLPGLPRGASFAVPRFTLPESRQLLENHLKRREGRLFQELSDDLVLRAHHLAVGNGIDLRELSTLMDSSG